MTANKRYFKREWEEEYYIFDSHTISEKEFDEKVQYEDYQAFIDSMSGDEVCNLLNKLNDENQQLSKDKQLAESELMAYKQRVKDELEMRYCLSNHKPVFEFMAKELDINLEGNVE